MTREKTIQISGSKSVWVQNPNFSNSYTLEKKDYITGKSWLHDKTKVRIFGWIEEVTYGERKGMIEATIPALREDENDVACEIIGYFNSIENAMAAIIKRNHPDYGIWI